MTHNAPRKSGYSGNICAFCHYWEGDAQLHRYSSTSMVEYDHQAKGKCLQTSGTIRNSSGIACPKFELSNEASRYAR